MEYNKIVEIVLLALLILLGSTVGTLAGFGTSTVMVPILSLFYPFPLVLAFVGIIHWFGDIWKILLFKKHFKLKLILLFGLTGIITSFIGAKIVFFDLPFNLKRLLGIFLIIYVCFLFWKPKFSLPKSSKHQVLGGIFSGFFAGLFGVGGAIRSTFLTAFNFPKGVYLVTSGAIAFLIDSTRLITYFSEGVNLPSNLKYGFFIFVPISFIGAKIAKSFIDKIPQQKFRKIITMFLFLVGLKFIVFG